MTPNTPNTNPVVQQNLTPPHTHVFPTSYTPNYDWRGHMPTYVVECLTAVFNHTVHKETWWHYDPSDTGFWLSTLPYLHNEAFNIAIRPFPPHGDIGKVLEWLANPYTDTWRIKDILDASRDAARLSATYRWLLDCPKMGRMEITTDEPTHPNNTPTGTPTTTPKTPPTDSDYGTPPNDPTLPAGGWNYPHPRTTPENIETPGRYGENIATPSDMGHGEL